MSDTVTISVKRYEQLLEAERFLSAIEAAGVDNWEGYSEAFIDDEDDIEDDE